MRLSVTATVAAALAVSAACPTRANAQGVATHQVHIACGIHHGDQKLPTQITKIVKVTMPSLPVGSSSPNTAMILDDGFRQLIIEQEIKHYKTFCITGESATQIIARLEIWEGRSGYGKRPKEEILYDHVWPALFDRLYKDHTIFNRNITRSMYVAEVVGGMPVQ